MELNIAYKMYLELEIEWHSKIVLQTMKSTHVAVQRRPELVASATG